MKVTQMIFRPQTLTVRAPRPKAVKKQTIMEKIDNMLKPDSKPDLKTMHTQLQRIVTGR